MGKEKLQNITICLPEIFIHNLKKLAKTGVVKHRSDGIRKAVKRFLKTEEKNAKLFGYQMRE